MNSKRIVFLLLAVIVAGSTAFLARAWLQGERAAILAHSNHPQEAPVAPAQKVLVAKSVIHTGQIIKPDDLHWQPWPGGELPSSYAVEGKRPASDFVGALARLPITVGEPVTETKLVLANARGFMAAVLQPGMRAVSLSISATSAVSGFIYAGDRVDVLLTLALTGGQGQHNATETILRNARVIAMDQKVEFTPGDKPDSGAKTSTLELTPKQAEIVTLAAKMGDISLVLRSLQENAGDDQPVADNAPAVPGDSYTRDGQVSRLIGESAAPPPGPAAEAARVVVILRGATASKSEVDGAPTGGDQAAGKPSESKPAPVTFTRTPAPSLSQ